MSTVCGKPTASGGSCRRALRPGSKGCGVDHTGTGNRPADGNLATLRAQSAVEVDPDDNYGVEPDDYYSDPEEGDGYEEFDRMTTIDWDGDGFVDGRAQEQDVIEPTSWRNPGGADIRPGDRIRIGIVPGSDNTFLGAPATVAEEQFKHVSGWVTVKLDPHTELPSGGTRFVPPSALVSEAPSEPDDCDVCAHGEPVATPGVLYHADFGRASSGGTPVDNVVRCDSCGRYEGDLEAARALTERLGGGVVRFETYGDDPDGPGDPEAVTWEPGSEDARLIARGTDPWIELPPSGS